MALTELLLEILEDLGDEELKTFKWFLQQDEILEDFQAIPKSHLEKADRLDTLDMIMQTYHEQSVVVTKTVLTKLNRNDLVQRLSNINSGPKLNDVGEVSQSRVAPFPHPSTNSRQTGDFLQPNQEPLGSIASYQHILQSHFQDRFICAQEGWTERVDKKQLDDIYVELCITNGSLVNINRQHEVRQIEMALREQGQTEETVQPGDIFKHPSGKNTPVRTVMTNGIAGIGKTFLVHKFILDWAEGRANQDVHLLFPFTFRQLNLIKGEKFCLAELIHECIRETKDIKEEDLNDILTTLQASGNTNYDKSKFKLLFILDGLDESRLGLNFTTHKYAFVDVTQAVGVEVLLTGLIKGELLPSARLWITTRPAAANQIPLDFVDIMTEVRGFTDPQKEEYFRRRFTEEKLAGRIISHIKASRSLHIMCHIPVFCWITATVLGDMFKMSVSGELPKTLTELYTEFLAFQIRQTQEKYSIEESIQYIQSLAKLAFDQLVKGNLIFYEKDLKKSGIDFYKASVYSGVFTQIFKKERRWRKDKDEDKMFSFVHLSIQEFLAAVYVVQSFINRNKNVMAQQFKFQSMHTLFNKPSIALIQRMAVDKALQSPDGYLDLFLRFLLGLFVEANQGRLHGLLKQTISSSQANKKTVQYIKEKIREIPSPERSINLFHCLNELNDCSLVEEIQQYLSSGCLSRKKMSLSPAQWSALVFILLSSERDIDVFDLKKYSATEEGLLRLLSVARNSNILLLSGCNLSERSCEALASVLGSQSSCTRELDLNNNSIQDSGVKMLSVGMESPHCKLKSLRLSGCTLSWRSCKTLSTVLSSQSSSLTELDLSNNDLKDSAVEHIHLCCRLKILRLDICNLSEKSCEALASFLSSQSSSLRKLDLSNNDLRDSGVKLLSAGLNSPHCRLQTLRLSGCLVTEEGCNYLASALSSNPSHLRELDLSYNHAGGLGVKLLLTGLKDPNWGLETLSLVPTGVNLLKSGLRKYACELALDPNTANSYLSLSEDNRTVTLVRERQLYPIHPDRFHHWKQLLCTNGLTGRCYWEVEKTGWVYVGVAYRGIRRKAAGANGCLGLSEKSWSICCSQDRYSAFTNNIMHASLSTPTAAVEKVAVYLDWPTGTLSFYRVSSDSLIHFHTFQCTFTEPVYPAFGFDSRFHCVVSLCQIKE